MENLNIPKDYQTVMPYLILKDAKGFLSFVQEVFGAKEKQKHMNDRNEIMHAEVIIGGSTIMFGSSTDQWSSQPAGLYIHVKNADETYNKALVNGAISLMKPEDKDYGRSGGVKDPFGNTWWITSMIN
jgi:PhnB protein